MRSAEALAESIGDCRRGGKTYVHHTDTNVLGKDRDLGYAAFQIDPAQEWSRGTRSSRCAALTSPLGGLPPWSTGPPHITRKAGPSYPDLE